MLKKFKKQNKTVQQVLPWSGMKSASSEFHLHIVIDSIQTDKINIENTVNKRSFPKHSLYNQHIDCFKKNKRNIPIELLPLPIQGSY